MNRDDEGGWEWWSDTTGGMERDAAILRRVILTVLLIVFVGVCAMLVGMGQGGGK